MFVAKVVGNVWATAKHPGLNGYKLLLIQQLTGKDLKPVGKVQMAVCDRIDAGIGDTVLVLDEGGSARMILQNDKAPVRTIIVGIIDTLCVEDATLNFT